MKRPLMYTAKAVFFAASASLVILASPVALAAGAGSIGAWQTSPNTIPANPVNASYVTANGYAYAIGGTNNFGNLDNVSYAKLNADGTTGAWISSPHTLPNSLFYSSAVTANGYVYVLGGYNFGFFDTVYYAPLNTDGSVGNWTTSPNHLPDAIYFGVAVTANGYVYYMSGSDASGLASAVYYAKLNTDGTIGSWTTSPNHLPDAIRGASAITANGYVYVIGGEDNSSELSTVYYAKLNADGSVGSWTTSPNVLPQALSGTEALTENNYVYVLGGNDGSNEQASAYYAKLNTDGTIGSWTTSPNVLPQALEFGAAYAANSYIYYAGGQNAGTAENAVYSAFVTPDPVPSAPAASAPAAAVTPAPDTGYGKPTSRIPLEIVVFFASIFVAGAWLLYPSLRNQRPS